MNLCFVSAALKALTRVVELEPDRSTAFYMLGLVNLALVEYQASLAAYLQCLELTPEYIPAMKGIAGTYAHAAIDYINDCRYGSGTEQTNSLVPSCTFTESLLEWNGSTPVRCYTLMKQVFTKRFYPSSHHFAWNWNCFRVTGIYNSEHALTSSLTPARCFPSLQLPMLCSVLTHMPPERRRLLGIRIRCLSW